MITSKSKLLVKIFLYSLGILFLYKNVYTSIQIQINYVEIISTLNKYFYINIYKNSILKY